ncbi:MAG: hypothetical protein ACP5LM_04155 [Thermoplasmata archaeon]
MGNTVFDGNCPVSNNQITISINTSENNDLIILRTGCDKCEHKNTCDKFFEAIEKFNKMYGDQIGTKNIEKAILESFDNYGSKLKLAINSDKDENMLKTMLDEAVTKIPVKDTNLNPIFRKEIQRILILSLVISGFTSGFKNFDKDQIDNIVKQTFDINNFEAFFAPEIVSVIFSEVGKILIQLLALTLEDIDSITNIINSVIKNMRMIRSTTTIKNENIPFYIMKLLFDLMLQSVMNIINIKINDIMNSETIVKNLYNLKNIEALLEPQTLIYYIVEINKRFTDSLIGNVIIYPSTIH